MKIFLFCITVSLISLLSAEIRLFSDEDTIPDRYIVKLKNGIDSRRFVNSRSLKRNDGVLVPLKDNVEFVYDTAFNGFSAELDETQLQLLDSMPEVEYIESDHIVTADCLINQMGSPWGLARTSTRNKLNFDDDNYEYIYDSTSGSGSTVYILDTGVKIDHEDFGGRASYGFNAFPEEGNEDLHGHGTHVAGTAAGTTYGIAKFALIVGVKVLNQNGSGSARCVSTGNGVTAGIDWVTKEAKPKSVINMSLSFSINSTNVPNQILAMEEAITKAVQMNITIANSAGNVNGSACDRSPSRHNDTLTVAASTINDTAASFTNYGECVAIIAPGVSVLSAWIGSTNATRSISGTSMAAPHVAGLAAYLMSQFDLNTPAEVRALMLNLSTENAVSGFNDETPNKLIFNGNNDIPFCSNAAIIKCSIITLILLIISFIKITKNIY